MVITEHASSSNDSNKLKGYERITNSASYEAKRVLVGFLLEYAWRVEQWMEANDKSEADVAALLCLEEIDIELLLANDLHTFEKHVTVLMNHNFSLHSNSPS